MPRSGIDQFGDWIKNQTWETVLSAEGAHDKARIFQNLLLEKMNFFLPEKVIKMSSDDKPWYSQKLKQMDRKKKREFRKHRRSQKYLFLETQYNNELKKSESEYYKNMIEDLKNSKPGQWFSKLKRMTSYDQNKSEEIFVDEISSLCDQEQSEKIADHYAKISNTYQPLQSSDIDLPKIPEGSSPRIWPWQVHQHLKRVRTNVSTSKGDISAKLIKEFSYYLSTPLSNILNTCIKKGQWPDLWKLEAVTPVPKVYPVKAVSNLRKILGLLNFNKIGGKIIAEWMVQDMKSNMDISQYGNEKGTSIQHYLVNMVHQILKALDNNSKGDTYAVLATLVDWKEAFYRQCPKLGIASFIKNGVRPALIPLLINYFQGRRMYVKWHGRQSSVRDLPGGGPAGATLGILEYLSQSSDSADMVPPHLRFKFIDDLSLLEIIDLNNVGLACLNMKSHVASDIPVHNQIIPPDYLKTSQYLHQIDEWTRRNKMELNCSKTKVMIFNFTRNYQFTTRLAVEDQNVEVIQETKLLGTIINSTLTWDSNTNYLVKKAFSRMRLLHKMQEYNASVEDMKVIYFLFIRSVIEQSCVVWHSSLTQENSESIEHVQKCAVRLMLQGRYKTYIQGLQTLDISSCHDRRIQLSLSFAKKSLLNDKMTHLFPLNARSYMPTRNQDKYKEFQSNTTRMANSTVPFLRKLLNNDDKTSS